MVPLAVPVAMASPADGFDNVTVKPSSGSANVSPKTPTVIVFDVSPAANVTVPDGRTPPAKSAAFAGFVPPPVTAQFTLPDDDVPPVRLTVKVNGVVPLLPSVLNEFA